MKTLDQKIIDAIELTKQFSDTAIKLEDIDFPDESTNEKTNPQKKIIIDWGNELTAEELLKWKSRNPRYLSTGE